MKEQDLVKKIVSQYVLRVLDAQMQTLVDQCSIDKHLVAHTDKIPDIELAIHVGGLMTTLTMLESIEYSDENVIKARGFCNNLASQLELIEPFEM